MGELKVTVTTREPNEGQPLSGTIAGSPQEPQAGCADSIIFSPQAKPAAESAALSPLSDS